MRRILSAWLPHWPITRLTRGLSVTPYKPVVTIENSRGVRRLGTVDEAGAAKGLFPGQALTNARAICPALVPRDADPVADAAALVALAAWCERYTPLVAPDASESLWLDISGCTHFFAGEAGLAHDLSLRLKKNGFSSRIAIASTTGAAWALAHAATGDTSCVIVPPGEERAAIASLPITALRLDPDTIAGLKRLGLHRIKALLRIPRPELTARFGPLPTLRLDQALGAVEEAIAWTRPSPPWFERVVFPEPIKMREDLARALHVLSALICDRLAAEQQGGHRFVVRFFRVDGTKQEISIATAMPIHDLSFVTKLLQEKLEFVDLGFGIEIMGLEVEEVVRVNPSQISLAAPASKEATDRVMEIVDQLTNRLGPRRVWRVAPHATHIPERAFQRIPPLPATAPSWSADTSAPRPIRLLRRPELIEATAQVPDDPPLLFRWRGALHHVRAAAGPERISAEWWRRAAPRDKSETDLIRDYYRVEDGEGARFWLFRTGLHRNIHAPSWYMHGLFA